MIHIVLPDPECICDHIASVTHSNDSHCPAGSSRSTFAIILFQRDINLTPAGSRTVHLQSYFFSGTFKLHLSRRIQDEYTCDHILSETLSHRIPDGGSHRRIPFGHRMKWAKPGRDPGKN